MQRKWADEAGFSIVEVLIAAAVLGIAVIGLALLFSLGQGLVLAQVHDRVALGLAVWRLEESRTEGFSAIRAGSTAIKVGTASELPVSGFPQYDRTTVVTCVDATTLKAQAPCPNPVTAVQITVTVIPHARQADSITLNSVLTFH